MTNTNNNEQLQKSILKIQTLREEYTSLLTKYEEAINNHMNSISKNDNPCINYSSNSKDVSQLCYDKIWHDQGCISKDIPKVNSSDTLNTIIKNIYNLSISTEADKQQLCYGTNSVNIQNNKKIIYPNQNDYAQIKQKTWWGTSENKAEIIDNADECIALCEATENCSGATFNPDKKMCWIRSGYSSITDGMTTDYALIRNNTYRLIELQNLNEQLLNLNRNILEEIKKIEPYVNDVEEQTHINSKIINDSYDTLLINNNDIQKQLNEYYDIQSQYDNSNLYITQQHYLYNIYAILALIIISITAKKVYEGENNFFILFIIGFIWALYILIIKMRKMN